MEQTLSDSRILIEPIINKKVHGVADHGKRFRYALKIKNLDERTSHDFVLKNVTLESAHGQNIVATESKTFYVPRLNTNEEKYLDIGDHSSFMHGLVKIGVELSPTDQTKIIACYQRMPSTNSFLYVSSNAWVDFFYIKSPQDLGHDRIVKRLKWLTVAILLLIAVQLVLKLV
ncbi:MAG: hypothetical protein ACAH17_01300 [Candidatus Paceibacterota bacterium]